MLLDSVVYYGFEDFGNEPFILSDDAEDYDQNDFPDVNQNNDQDEEKMDVDCKHEYISSEEQKQRQIFIRLFRSGKYLTANSMYESRKLNGKEGKFMILMIIINYIIRSKVIEDIMVHLEAKSCQKNKSKMH